MITYIHLGGSSQEEKDRNDWEERNGDDDAANDQVQAARTMRSVVSAATMSEGSDSEKWILVVATIDEQSLQARRPSDLTTAQKEACWC
mmetsp:Transcript_59183/g.130006  ORF Transcript_59183/g.130006 Transcript_59183/m.130006 type:complete len:89 (-) Transcript_59183:9-275(-)